MELLVMLVVLVGGGLFAYRQWTEIKRDKAVPAQRTEIMRADEPSGPIRNDSAQPSAPKAKINKYVLVALAALYIASPIDFLPDVIPVLGWGDDIGALLFGLRAMFRRA